MPLALSALLELLLDLAVVHGGAEAVRGGNRRDREHGRAAGEDRCHDAEDHGENAEYAVAAERARAVGAADAHDGRGDGDRAESQRRGQVEIRAHRVELVLPRGGLPADLRDDGEDDDDDGQGELEKAQDLEHLAVAGHTRLLSVGDVVAASGQYTRRSSATAFLSRVHVILKQTFVRTYVRYRNDGQEGRG